MSNQSIPTNRPARGNLSKRLIAPGLGLRAGKPAAV
jgi:hypothetical protein